MPNWAYTQYKIEGDKEEVLALYNKIKSLDGGDTSLIENGFGKLWLGNLVHALGGDWKNIYCRGQITDYSLLEDILTINTETAWEELAEVRHFLEGKYPSLSIWYMTEEPGMCIYETNDPTGEIFPDRWLLDYCPDGTCEAVYEYFPDLKTTVEWLQNEDMIPDNIEPTKGAIVEALKKNMKDPDDGWVSLNEFQVVEY